MRRQSVRYAILTAFSRAPVLGDPPSRARTPTNVVARESTLKYPSRAGRLGLWKTLPTSL